jgi:hypothetical protein
MGIGSKDSHRRSVFIPEICASRSTAKSDATIYLIEPQPACQTVAEPQGLHQAPGYGACISRSGSKADPIPTICATSSPTHRASSACLLGRWRTPAPASPMDFGVSASLPLGFYSRLCLLTASVQHHVTAQLVIFFRTFNARDDSSAFSWNNEEFAVYAK